MWEKASSLSMSKKRKSPKTLHLQVTVELTELKSTLGDVQSSLTSSLASIQGDINPDVFDVLCILKVFQGDVQMFECSKY